MDLKILLRHVVESFERVSINPRAAVFWRSLTQIGAVLHGLAVLIE